MRGEWRDLNLKVTVMLFDKYCDNCCRYRMSSALGAWLQELSSSRHGKGIHVVSLTNLHTNTAPTSSTLLSASHYLLAIFPDVEEEAW